MRTPPLCLLLAACAAPPHVPLRHVPAVAIGFEPVAALIAPPTPKPAPPCRLRLSLAAAVPGPSAASEPLDTRITTVISAEGEPFRGDCVAMRGWALDREADGESGAADRLRTAPLGDDFATRIAFDDPALPVFLVRRFGERLQLALRTPNEPHRLALLTDPGFPLTEPIVLRHIPSGLLVRLEVDPAPPSPEALAEVRAALEAKAPEADPEPPVWPVELAREAVGPGPRRRALVALADEFDLPRCVDLALSAGERPMRAIARAVAAADHDPWSTERSFWLAILPSLQREEASPALRATVLRQLGATGLDPFGLEFLLRSSATLAAFEAGLETQNRRALDARRASRRVVAARWLRAHGLNLFDYDPLADRPARRAALSRVERSADGEGGER